MFSERNTQDGVQESIRAIHCSRHVITEALQVLLANLRVHLTILSATQPDDQLPPGNVYRHTFSSNILGLGVHNAKLDEGPLSQCFLENFLYLEQAPG
jgi:hypothetical protein